VAVFCFPRGAMNDPEADADSSDEGGTKERLADLLIRFCAAVGGLAYVPSAYLAWREGLRLVLAADSIALLAILALAFLRSIPYRLKIASILAMSYFLGIVLLAAVGPFGAGHLYLFCFVVLAGLFGSVRRLAAANVLCAASYALFAAYAAIGRPPWAQGVESVIVISANAVLIGIVLSAAANYLVSRYAAAAAAERRLRRLRETMLQEIDHRVKNNIQMILSLVSLRSRSGADPAEALDRIEESLSAIALVHQLLDREEARYSLKAGRYLDALFSRFGSTYPGVSFEYGWEGPEIEVDSDAGVDLGMMINEIVVNSVNHAFGDGKGGRIFLRASSEAGTRKLSLVVGDDGRGASGGSEPAGVKGKGRKIIEALAKHIGAEMRVDSSEGFVYRFELSFPEVEGAETPLPDIAGRED
jgi:two-component sensor histidine kinase